MTSSGFRIGGHLYVRRLGFGAMHLPTEPHRARETSLAVARRAVELGITLIDTAYLYGGGANEELLAEALHPYPDEVLVTTKIGMARSGPAGEWKPDGRPAVLRDQVEQALRRLRVERIELLQLHRIDPETPLADQIGTLRDLRAEGSIGHIGLSEITVDELHQAREIVDIASVQNRYNLLDREHDPVLAACEAAGVAFLPWRPVARGESGAMAEVAAVAAELDATPTQVALAWLLGRSPVVLPIPGTARIDHLEENLAAEHLQLTGAHRARLDRLHEPAQGSTTRSEEVTAPAQTRRDGHAAAPPGTIR
ncbi:aldo/keto reductase [Streptomyces sp. NPDC091376]|uniref:aldo/keto reductase n=1 Tax=Streptomyces sp. NPDC091376 TaxID=3365994 RepID=UPI0038145BE6